MWVIATMVAKRVLNSCGSPLSRPTRLRNQVMPVKCMSPAKTPPSVISTIQAVVRTRSEVQNGSSTKIIRIEAVLCGEVASR